MENDYIVPWASTTEVAVVLLILVLLMLLVAAAWAAGRATDKARTRRR
jgi:hypothetical protein